MADNQDKEYFPVMVQKYIEKPLLIHKRKFDIEIELLKEEQTATMLNDLCGARLAKFRSVAQKGAHEFIPSSCIWAKETFSTWLASENEGRDLWEESVFPQMKNILNEVTNDSFEEEQNLRKNTFELFGADFMIDEKLNVFLLEINKSPDPAANTKIQRRLFEGIASDTIKVNFINHFSLNFINYTKLPIRHFS
jgi:tubulin monoglycylase TTLL3/8